MDVRSLLFGFLVLAMVAAGCSGDDDDAATSTTTVAPAATVTEDATTTTSVRDMEVSTSTVPSAEVIEGAFTFADDDLCEWVSAEKVADFVATEFDDPDVTVVLDERSGGPEDPDSCQWLFLASTAPDEFGWVSAGNASTWEDFSDNSFDLGKVEVVDFDEAGGYSELGSAYSGHPSLSDGVVVWTGGFGSFAFWVPPSDEYLSLGVSFPEVEPDFVEGDFEARFFGVADRFVQELGWLG